MVKESIKFNEDIKVYSKIAIKSKKSVIILIIEPTDIRNAKPTIKNLVYNKSNIISIIVNRLLLRHERSNSTMQATS
jgi:MinD-like ATPase involved in chromosome partitioning or flagellar assembly